MKPRRNHKRLPMAYHEIPARDPAKRVVVGWDPPLQTYFVQVIDRAREAQEDDENDKFDLWVGCTFGEIDTIDGVAGYVSPHAELTGLMRATLYCDRTDDK